MSLARPPRESYVRTSRPCADMIATTVEPGVEYRDGDDFDKMVGQLYTILVKHDPGDCDAVHPVKLAESIEGAIAATWPGRAYFVEVHSSRGWYQVFQPFGLPRNA
jgi:hypothetical protein